MTMENRKRKGNRLGKCDVCRSKDAIYTCPKCEAVSCSLNCVKSHKKELGCDGVRVRTKYVAKDKLDEHSLLSDYRLLEDVRRCVELAEQQNAVLDTFQCRVSSTNVDSRSNQNDSKPEPEKVVLKAEMKHESEVISVKKKKPRRKRMLNVKVKGGVSSNSKDDKGLSSPAVCKTDILIARAKRLKQNALRHKKCHNITTNSSVSTPHQGGSISPALPVPETPLPEDQKNISQSKSIFSEEENLNASVQLKEALRSVESSSATDVPNPDSEMTEEGALKCKPNSANEMNKVVPARPRSNQKAFYAKLKSRILRTIRQGGKRKELAFEALQKAALTRGVVLNSLPMQFQRHWENSSFFFARENLIYWHVKLCFINANCYSLSLSECSESMILEELIKRCLNRTRNFHRKRKMKDPLVTYRKLGMGKISVLMAADRVPNSQRKFYQIDLKKTLRENFEGKSIIEFPQLCVALQDCHAVSAVQETPAFNFFEDNMESDEESSLLEPNNQFEEALKKKAEKRKEKMKRRKEKAKNANGESDRESGELTESSDDSFFDTDSEQSEEELFKESEFRSIYKDLLKTFDNDVSKL